MSRVNIVKRIKIRGRWKTFSIPRNAKGNYDWNAIADGLAVRAKPELLSFLDLIAEHSGAEVVHLVAHSMGALALSEAVVEYLATRTGGEKPAFREIILAAPDIDEKVFRDIVPKIVNKGPHLTLYASRRDYALLCSGTLRFGLPRAGMVVGGKPVVVMDGSESRW